MINDESKRVLILGIIAVLAVVAVMASFVLALMQHATPLKEKAPTKSQVVETSQVVFNTVETDPPRKRSKRERRIKKSLGRLPVMHTRYERRVKPSTYLGKWYRPKAERNRRCIVWRESNAILHVRNGGLYQFEQPTSDHVARLIGRPDLVGTSATYWSRKEQDKGFWRLWEGRKGAFHWQGGNWDCLRKVNLS